MSICFADRLLRLSCALVSIVAVAAKRAEPMKIIDLAKFADFLSAVFDGFNACGFSLVMACWRIGTSDILNTVISFNSVGQIPHANLESSAILFILFVTVLQLRCKLTLRFTGSIEVVALISGLCDRGDFPLPSPHHPSRYPPAASGRGGRCGRGRGK
jgi:hypothetical protein